MYVFQSLDRNLDLAGKAVFKNYQFTTDNEEMAAFLRRNCEKQPHNIWELKVGEENNKPKRGRPSIAVRGMRTSELAEGASV